MPLAVDGKGYLDKDQAELTCRSLIESYMLDGVTGFQKYLDGLYQAAPVTLALPLNAFQRLRQESALWKAGIGIGYEDILEGAQLVRLGSYFRSVIY